jgi:hypothetical protein
MGILTKEDTKRLHITLPAKSVERLDAIVLETEATGYAEVLKNALRLYEAVLAEVKKGNDICIKEQNGSIRTYSIFG